MRWFFACLALVLCTPLAGVCQEAGGRPQLRPGPQPTGIKVIEAVVCARVVNRMPVGKASVFSIGDGKVFCFTRVLGARGNSTITHNWYCRGMLRSSVKLPVRSPDFRTWSAKTFDQDSAGDWMVEILDGNGAPLENLTFVVQ